MKTKFIRHNSILFIMLISFMIVSFFSLQSCTPNDNISAPPEPNIVFKKENVGASQFSNHEPYLNNSLTEITKELAKTLNDDNIKTFLFNKLKENDYEINILSILDEKITQKGNNITLLDILSKQREMLKSEFLSELSIIPKECFRLSLPVKKHREIFLESKNIDVAVIGNKLDGDEDDIIAFSSTTYKKQLSAKMIPNNQILVLGTVLPINRISSSYSFPKITENSVWEGISNTTSSEPIKVICESFTVGTNHDAWYDDEMEIYFVVSAQNPDGSWVPWWSVTLPIPGFREDVAKYVGQRLFYTTQGIYSFKIRVQVWEADTGSSDDLVSDGYLWTLMGTPVPYFTYFTELNSSVTRKWTKRYLEVANPNDINVLDLMQTFLQGY